MPRSARPEIAIKQNKEKMNSERLSFPTTPYPHGILFIFKQYDYNDLDQNYQTFSSPQDLQSNQTNGITNANSAQISKTSSIELPFPTALSDDISVKLEGFEQNGFVAAIAKGIKNYGEQSGGSIGDTIKNAGSALMSGAGAFAGAIEAVGGMNFSDLKGGASEGLGKAGDMISNALKSLSNIDNKTAAAATRYALQQFLPISGDMGKTIDAVTGKIINPKETLAFGGVDLKTYAFEWTLYPSSPADSVMIKNIVNLFKRNALPSFQSVTGMPRVFLNYPSVVDVSLIGVDETYYPRFKPSMISKVDVDYSGGTDMAILKGGRPVAVTIGIEIAELGIHTAEDYGSEGNEVIGDAVVAAVAGDSA